ncbi:hypothetical protein ElyMa_003270100 [Elysia marginata]|uniref:Uncharacterized protein n=1 Tax=Elysia marginata TaxID=1093978 RepID=A0AAV4JDS9_9GAST|nr:hypothetical protein ElyMa_003270100 [Elysia marginata]
MFLDTAHTSQQPSSFPQSAIIHGTKSCVEPSESASKEQKLCAVRQLYPSIHFLRYWGGESRPSWTDNSFSLYLAYGRAFSSIALVAAKSLSLLVREHHHNAIY